MKSMLVANSCVLLLRDAAGDEDAQMPDLVVHAVDDGLAVGADVLDAAVEVEDPVQRLLRRRDVVALRAEADDRRLDVAQIDAGTPSPVTISAVASLLPTNRLSTIHCISSALRRTWPPHHFSKPR